MAVDEPVRLVGDAALEADEPWLGGGYLCLCEDVALHDAEQAWAEGFRSAEILKRYTTATMGPCKGAMCGHALACFARGRADAADARSGARPTARPPLRPVALQTLAAPVHEVIEKRTGLHDAHVAAGAALGWSSGWKRPIAYADPADEYRAVRERVGLMDVGTLGRFLIGGRDATTLADAVFAGRIEDLAPGRSRYVLALDEGGYVVDDGLLCTLEDGSYLLTSTSGGAERMDARLREWAERLGLHVHVLDRTSELGAILVAGPRARDLVGGLTEDPIDAASLPYPGHRELIVAGVPCRAIRSGFVGELAFELHHPRSNGPELWASLQRAGRDLGVSPFGLEALELLRLEKGHVYLGPGHAARRHAGQARARPGRRHDQAVVRRQGRARTPGRAAAEPEARRAGLRGRNRRRRAPGGAAHRRLRRRRSRHLGRTLARAGSSDRARVDPASRRRVPERPPGGERGRQGRSDPVLRPRGNEGPWLSSGPGRRR